MLCSAHRRVLGYFEIRQRKNRGQTLISVYQIAVDLNFWRGKLGSDRDFFAPGFQSDPLPTSDCNRATWYAATMADKHFDRNKLEAQLNELSQQIHELVTKLETAVGREAEALRPKLKAAQERLLELRETSREAWGDLKPGLAKVWEELQKSLNQAASRFKTRPKE